MAEQTTQPGANGKDTVGTGTNTLETTGNPKLDARKALFALADSSRAADVSIDEETHPSTAAIAAAIAEAAGGELSEEDARAISGADLLAHVQALEDPDGAAVEEVEEQTDPGPDAVVVPAEVTPPGDEQVALLVFGQTLYMPKDEVAARGGVAVVQMQLAADHRFRQATHWTEEAKRLHTAAQSKLDEVKRLEGELLQSSAAGGTPAGQQQGKPTQPTQLDDSLRAAVKHLVGEMYKGDNEATEKALTDVFATVQVRGGQTPNAETIAKLVQAKVDAALLRARAEDSTAQVKRANKREADEVNNLMATKYSAIDTDLELRAAAQGLFRAARADPRNKGRSLVSIADDVGARMLEITGLGAAAVANPPVNTPAATRQELRTRTTLKRRLPQPSSVSERSPETETQPSYPTKASEVVNLLRAARGQPPL